MPLSEQVRELLRHDAVSSGYRGDANDLVIFFEKELEATKARSYDVLRTPLNGMRLVPVSYEAGPGAETIRYEQYDLIGQARILANYGDDLPRADVVAREFRSPIRGIGNSYGYSLQEIRAAAMAGKPLEQRKANAALRAQQELWNRIVFNGDTISGLSGWISSLLIEVAAAGTGTAGATTFASKTADNILADLNAIANNIVDRTNGVETPDTLVMPIAQYNLINTTPRSATSDTTIREFYLGNQPYIKNIEVAPELKGAGSGATDLMIAYTRSPDKLTFEMPQPFEQLPVQVQGLKFVVPCHSRVGGVIVYYPYSMAGMHGI